MASPPAPPISAPSSGKRPAPPLDPPSAPRTAVPAPKKMRLSELLGIPPPSAVPSLPDEHATMLTVSGEWAAAEALTRDMPRDQGVPLTILTGFLGAGKSTVLNYILKADHGMKVAVLINEFGEVDIDNQLVDTVTEGEEGDPVMLNNGCICCTVSNGFIDAVQSVLAKADASGSIPDYFIVETTGLADPKPILDSVSNTELREELYVDQVLTVVDASAFSETHYGSDTARKQIEAADTVLLSKTDLANEDTVKKAIASVYEIRPNARILKSQKGHVPIAALFDLGMSLTNKPAAKHNRNKDDKTVAEKSARGNGTKENDTQENGVSHANHDHTHDHKESHDVKHNAKDGHDHKHEHGESCGKECDHAPPKKPNHLEEEGFTSISFVTEHSLSLRRFKDNFMDRLPVGVFRSKGILMFANFDTRFIFHWSGNRYNVEEEQWPEGAAKRNQLVVIGRDLDKPKITEMLTGCIVLPGEESEDEEYDDGGEGLEESGEEGVELNGERVKEEGGKGAESDTAANAMNDPGNANVASEVINPTS